MINYGFTQDNFGFHTFSLVKRLDSKDEYSKLARIISRTIHIPKNKNGKMVSIKEKGALINLYRNHNAPSYLEVIVNPRVLLGDETYIGIFNATADNVSEMINKLNSVLSIFGEGYTFESMILSRLDLCVNIHFDSPYDAERYIKVIQKSQIPYGYKKVVFDKTVENYRSKNNHSYCISSNDCNITIYDKLWQMNEEGLSETISFTSLLRFETSLRREAIKDYIDKNSISSNRELILYFGNNSDRIFARYFFNVFPFAIYVPYRLAREIIINSDITDKMQHRMIKFLDFLAGHRILNNALKDFQYKENLTDPQVDKMMEKFDILGVSPVTIPMEWLPNDNSVFILPGVMELLGLMKFFFKINDKWYMKKHLDTEDNKPI